MNDPFQGFGIQTGGICTISPTRTEVLCRNGAAILDIRNESQTTFKAFDVPQVFYCPLEKLDLMHEELPVDIPLIIADASGIQARMAAKQLLDAGFKGWCAVLGGGLVDWERAGLPVSTDVKERLSGGCACQLKQREKK
jgi:rhodanese-related sulfurtransferase